MRITKRTFALFLVLVLLFTSLCSVNIFADTTNLRYFERGVLTDGTNTAYYIIDKDNRVLYLSGDGVTNARTPDYPSADAGPFAGRTDVTRIVIEEGVARIGDYVFANMKSVDTLEIQSNLLSSDSNMSAKAMIGCTSLRNIQGDNALLSTNVMLEVIKGAINVATAQWWNLALNGVNVIKTGVSGDNSLDDEIVAAMINDYIMTGDEVFLGNLEQAVTDYETRIGNPCYSNNEFHHTYLKYVSKQATCTEKGQDMYVCSTCDDTYFVETEALGHSYESSVMFEPTCTREGILKSACTRCGNCSYTAIAPTGHTDGEWVTVTEPSRTGSGKTELHCAICDEVIGEAPYNYYTGVNISANTAAQIKSAESDSTTTVMVFDSDGELLADSAKVGTGCIIKYIAKNNPNKIYKVTRVVLYGDVNGDGIVDAQDKSLLYDEAFVERGTIDSGSVYYLAADMNRDKTIDAFDCFLQDGIATGGRSFDQSIYPFK